MIADVIIGKNIDTSYWIRELKSNLHEYIFVVDYDYYIDPEIIDNVTYVSHIDAKNLLKKFDSVVYYKSMYIFPGTYNLRCSSKINKSY